MRQRVLALLGSVALISLIGLALILYNADRQLFDKVIPEHQSLHAVEIESTALMQLYYNYMFVPGSVDHLDIHRVLASLREKLMGYRDLIRGNADFETDASQLESAIDVLEQSGSRMIALRLELERLFEQGALLEDEIRMVFDQYDNKSDQALRGDIDSGDWDRVVANSLPDVRMISGIKQQLLELFLEIREYQSNPNIDVLNDIRGIESRLELSLTLLRIYVENESERADDARAIIAVYQKLDRLIEQYAQASTSAIESVRQVEHAGMMLSESLEQTALHIETAGWNSLRQSLLAMAAILVLALIGSFLLLYLGIGKILNPLRQLQLAFTEIGEGRLQAQTDIELNFDDREMSQLVDAFNDMALQLRQSEVTQQSFIEHLEEKNTELERFTYTVSHELKSPLVTISGLLGLLKRDLAARQGERVDEYIEKIVGAVQIMSRQLEDLLELSRVGRAANPATRFSLTDLCNEVIEMLQGSIDASGAEVIIEPDMPEVLADRVRIGEVITNLIENGIKFSSRDQQARVEVSAALQENELLCRVRDNGPGIDPRYHDRVFELFDRLDPEVPGTGIGLALARRIVEIHRGRIWIESDGDGQGCCFCFTLAAPGGALE